MRLWLIGFPQKRVNALIEACNKGLCVSIPAIAQIRQLREKPDWWRPPAGKPMSQRLQVAYEAQDHR